MASKTLSTRFSASGASAWSQRYGDGSHQQANGVAATADDGMIVTGAADGTVDFGGGPLAALGGLDVFLVKLTGSGGHLWSKRYGSSEAQEGLDVAVDPATGDILLTGSFVNTIDFGGDTLAAAGIATEVFLARLASDGAHSWSRKFGGTDSQDGRAVSTDESGRITLAGVFQGDIDLGGGLLEGAPFGSTFVAKLDGNGEHLWSKGFGTFLAELSSAAVDASGSVVLAGTYFGPLDFGGGALAQPANNLDIFLAKLGP